ncbi:phosphotransferase [Deinococcus sp. A31D244]|uniref:phosphotransferase n=1 Tax=Deinococcus sp. A31D244 TaxID=3397675 RepID=UPI0039DFD4FE
MCSGPAAALADTLTVLRGDGPVILHARRWPRDLHALFPGLGRPLERWVGEGAAFARFGAHEGPLFLKFIPAGWRDRRAWERLTREAAYLRDLAPLSPVPHAPFRHAAQSARTPHAHLLTRDLTEETTGWGAFADDAARGAALLEIARLLARHHAFWAGPGQAALRGAWAWQPEHVLERAARMHAQLTAGGLSGPDGRPAPLPEPVVRAARAAAGQLPALLAAAPLTTLVHGDIHAGQVLWRGPAPVLIDYGQVHPSVPGEDLAHLLALRLDAADRARLGPELRAVYRDELARCGLPLTDAELAAQERAGLALNLLSVVRQAARTPERSTAEAALKVTAAWEEQAG